MHSLLCLSRKSGCAGGILGMQADVLPSQRPPFQQVAGHQRTVTTVDTKRYGSFTAY